MKFVAFAFVVGLSVLLVAPAPSYDPWAWLLWGREVTRFELSTAEGPAFKPLPVFVCALLRPLGGAAPEAWVLVARAGAVLAVWLGFRLGRSLAGTAAGVVAAVGVAFCGGFLGYAAHGAETGWTIAFALAAVLAWRDGRFGWALAFGVGCALLRVEAWPFLLVAGVVLWRREHALRPWLVACAVAVPALWFVPEWLGSGDVLRSGSRARVTNPGQPANAAVPALAALREAAALPLWPLWLGAVLCALPAARAARPVLYAGLAWLALVAAMAQAGFSGEPRYSLPGGALIAVAGAAALVLALRDGAARPSAPRTAAAAPRTAAAAPRTAAAAPRGAAAAPRTAAAAPRGAAAAPRGAAAAPPGTAARPRARGLAALLVVALLVAAAPKFARLDDLRRDQAFAAELVADLERVIVAGGGRDAILACGRPYVGNLRGPLLAYHLDVEKQRVQFEPVPPGVVFLSRLRSDSPLEPRADGFTHRASAGRWELRVRCP